MNNFYHKVAVTSICTALSFTLVTHKEAKAATFTLSFPETQFFIEDTYPHHSNVDAVGDTFVSPNNPDSSTFYSVLKFPLQPNSSFIERERRAFYEFNISNLSLAPNTVIRSVTFQQQIEYARRITTTRHIKSFALEIFGYVGNGKPDLLDFGAGVGLGIKDAVLLTNPDFFSVGYGIPTPYNPYYNGGILSLDVTQFVNERVSNGDAFAGFGIRARNQPYSPFPNHGVSTLRDTTLIIETEPVPEPTTIFGSALALGVGGWLKRKKSSHQNKTTSQH
jgi:hypothetical protein